MFSLPERSMNLYSKNISNYFGVLVFFTAVFFGESSNAQQQPSPLLVQARQDMPGAFKDDAESIALYNKLKNVENPEPILKGYIGAVNMARARHAPLSQKRMYLRKGIDLLEQAIKEKPKNTELLFLRLTIQSKLPSFLGYNDNIDEDKKFVLANYNNSPPPLKERIANFITKSEDFTEEEKALVK